MKSTICLAIFLISENFLPAQSEDITAIAARESSRVVSIIVIDESGEETGQGSGFIVRSNGVIVTNFHVLQGVARASVRLANGDIYDSIDVVDYDERRDLLLIKIKVLDLDTVVLGDSNRLNIGDRLVAIGNPLGLSNTVSDGILSAERHWEGSRYLQLTTPISPGSSGGPVFNLAGEVVGITTFTVLDGQNLNFAVPINYLKPLITDVPKMSLEEFAMKFPEKDIEEGLEELASEIAPNASADLNKRSEAIRLWQRASELFVQNRNDQALDLLEQALEIDPTYAEGYMGLAEIYSKKGEPTKALVAVQTAIRLNPDDPGAHYTEGTLYVWLEMYTEAIESLKLALKQDPRHSYAHGFLGLAYYKKALYDSAIYELQQSISIRPNYSAAYVDLAFAYEAIRNYDRAIKTLERYLKVAEDDPTVAESAIQAAKDKIKQLKRMR